MKRIKILRGFVAVTGWQSASYIMSFLRNIILARELSRYDFGLATVFAMILSLFDFGSRLSVGRQIVQDEEGGKLKFLNSAHSANFIAGIISSILLLCLAYPCSVLLKVPEQATAFMIIAAVPVIRALSNLDFQRVQRDLNFLPSILVDVIPQFIFLCLTWPIAIFVCDFRVILIIIIGKEVFATIISHYLAKVKFKMSWDKEILKRISNFGWPLLVNGVIIFIAQQGDQFLIGGGISVSDLAVYAACASIIEVPYMILSQSAGSILLPILSSLQKEKDSFRKEYDRAVHIVCITSSILIPPIIILADIIMVSSYGKNYSNAGLVFGILSLSCGIRLMKLIPTTAAMALGNTKLNLISNVGRTVSIPLGIIIIMAAPSIEGIAICSVFGEIVSLAVALYVGKKQSGLLLKQPMIATALLGLLISLSIVITNYFNIGSSLLVHLILVFIAAIGAIGLSFLIFPSTSLEIQKFFKVDIAKF
jgi:O-antigen/teichoic acid export membrane protein